MLPPDFQSIAAELRVFFRAHVIADADADTLPELNEALSPNERLCAVCQSDARSVAGRRSNRRLAAVGTPPCLKPGSRDHPVFAEPTRWERGVSGPL